MDIFRALFKKSLTIIFVVYNYMFEMYLNTHVSKWRCQLYN